jgi:hypothetical protein
MPGSTILLIVLIVLFIFSLPTWPHSARWGFIPSGGVALVIVVVLVVTGRY